MPKTAIAVILAGFVLAAAASTSATAMQVVPLSKDVLSNLSGDVFRHRMAAVLARPLGSITLHLVLA